MINGLLIDRLSNQDNERLDRVWSSQQTIFTKLAELAELDRASAWRHLDLSGVDFTDCDLRGYDFTGADLRGCTGSNVIIDASTILHGAELDASIFVMAAEMARVFDEYPDLRREYRKIKGAYWTDQHNWVADVLARKGKNPEARRALALSLFFDTKDPFVRRSILYFAVFKGGDARDSLGFLARFVSNPSENIDALNTAIRFVSTTYQRNEGALALLFTVAEDERYPANVRVHAITGALLHHAVTRHMGRAFTLVKEWNLPVFENLYIRVVAAQLSPVHVMVVGEGKLSGGINLTDPIDDVALYRIISAIWSMRHDPSTRRLFQLKDTDARSDLIEPVIQCLEDLQGCGLKLKLAYDRALVEAVSRRPQTGL